MKVILTQNVSGQGKIGDVIDVSDGYAKNYLIKNKLGFAATASTLNEINMKKAAEAAKRAKELAEAKELAAKINGKRFTVKVKAGEKGKVFGSVSNQQIADEMTKQGFPVQKQQLITKEQIKNVGEYNVEARLYAEVLTKFVIVVVAE